METSADSRLYFERMAIEREARAELQRQAKVHGYETEPCQKCGNYTLVRNGTYLKCDTCGEESGKTLRDK